MIRRTERFRGLRGRPAVPGNEELLVDRSALTSVEWIDSQIGGSVSLSAEAGPFGGDAFDLAFTSSSSRRLMQLVRNSQLDGNGIYRASCWVRAPSGTVSMRLGVPEKNGGTSVGGDAVVSTSWVQVSHDVNVGFGGSDSFFQIRNGSDGLARTIIATLPSLRRVG